MSGNKAALKAAKTALDAEKYDEVVTQCQIVLASDSQNYFAYVAADLLLRTELTFIAGNCFWAAHSKSKTN